jgi:endonuclease/exonuclease/phosphatase family metal-dependent hydrolase
MKSVLRVATYNIHKGVRGIGLARRLEIHNLQLAVEQLDADIVCLQEVRQFNRLEARRLARWPAQPQADYLAPDGYHAVYRTNAYTRHGEHGNALLTRWPVIGHAHEDMSDHRFEQRGLLHVQVQAHGQPVHVIVVHLGLIAGSRRRQVDQLADFISREVPAQEPLVVAGDFNDWGGKLREPLALLGLKECAQCVQSHDLQADQVMPTAAARQAFTFPSRLPLAQLDFVYVRGLAPLAVTVPRGPVWGRMSDHLPLIADLELLPLQV